MLEKKIQTPILEIKNLSPSLYIIKLEKKTITFKPGQHITLGIPGEDKSRLYSVASGINDQTLDVLVREIPNGDLSKRFRMLEEGTLLEVSNPVGYFNLPDNFKDSNILCICTGSGIAPYRSFVHSYPEYSFKIIHGIQNLTDSLQAELPDHTEYITCTSRSKEGRFHGRVTEYIINSTIDSNGYYYLCGNGEMIHELYNFLKNKGVSRNNIFYEEYFNN